MGWKYVTTNINGYTEHQSADGTNNWQNSDGQVANGWQNNANDWYHFNNGQINTGWNYIDNNWYYMNPTDNVMESGLQTINNSRYYLNPNHDGSYGAMKTGWQAIDNNWYYFAGNGAATSGWQWLGNNWFYFDPSTNQMQSGLTDVNGTTYYLNEQHDGTYGAMKTGWQLIDNNWYGFAGNGAALNNWQAIGNHWYYFNHDGETDTGWQTINGHRYYFDLTNSWALAGWQQIDGDWYYFDPANTWLLNGWQTINGQTYYLDPTTGQMKTGIQLIDGQHYFFGPSGAEQRGFILNPTTKLLQYYDLNNGTRQQSVTLNGKLISFVANGDIDTNQLTDGLNWLGQQLFYFSRRLNQFLNDSWKALNNHWYYFGDNGAATTGWYKSPAGFWYFFNNDGTARTGWQKINGNWYLFDDTNANAKTGWFKSNAGFWYYFDPTNAWADTSWAFINHNWYYFDPVNAYMYTGGHWINGHWVNLQSWGGFVGFNARVINWFLSREGKLTYSMYGSRTGADGTADCSGSMTMAVWSAGGSRPSHIYSTLDLGGYLLQNGYYLAGRGYGVQNVQYGDIVIWGTPGHSAGGAGHTVVVSSDGPSPMCISTNAYYSEHAPWGHGDPNMAVQEFDYQQYWNEDDRPYQMVYRPNFYWA